MLETSFLKKILLEQQYLTDEDIKHATEYEVTHEGGFLRYLYEHELLSESTLGLAVAEHYKTTFTDLNGRALDQEAIERIPDSVARTHRVVFVRERDNTVTVATDTFDQKKKLTAELSKLFAGKKVLITYTFPESIEKALSFYETELNTRFSEIVKQEQGVAPELFKEILADAILYRTSDIHFEPREGKAYIRFRVDGVLRLAGTLDLVLYANLLNRIKIEANLRTDEHFAPQDGAIRFIHDEKQVDLRVSITPIVDGEKAVIRILAEYIKDISFSELGFSEHHIALFEKVQAKPFGMIVVTGPTGSGKTTTLYSFVKQVNRPEINVTTIEDPVEYYMAGTNQIQVNQRTGITFAKGLRSIVRQDPDVILLGEIRDTETAETAVNASLTGHMLLSTFHANNAATAIPRILDMGIEPFLLASTLELVVSQRLARRICESCRYSYTANVGDLKKEFPGIEAYFKKRQKLNLYKGAGCPVCNHTGYNGRIAVVEAIEVDKSLKELIHQNPTTAQVWAVAKENGAESMFEDGLRKAQIGLTTVQEVLRVTEMPAN